MDREELQKQWARDARLSEQFKQWMLADDASRSDAVTRIFGEGAREKLFNIPPEPQNEEDKYPKVSTDPEVLLERIRNYRNQTGEQNS